MKVSQTPNADLMQPIDIGLPVIEKTSEKLPARRVRSPETEVAARKQTLLVPLEDVQQEWLANKGMQSIISIAHHYNVFSDLFLEPHFFHPVVQLDLFFPEPEAQENAEEVLVSPVFFGNTLPAVLAAEPPNLRFEAPECARKGFWTLAMTSPDEHLEDSGKEYLHWMV